jgi:PAS domain S-box-containing protein
MENDIEYKKFYDTAPVGFYRTCLKTGKFLKANPMCLKMLGYDTLESLQDSVTAVDLYPVEIRHKLIERVKNEGKVSDFEVHIRLSCGEEKWVMVSASLCDDEPCLEGSLTDVTARKRLEQKVIDLQENEITEMSVLKEAMEKRIACYPKAESA